jgi:hypothetical protein
MRSMLGPGGAVVMEVPLGEIRRKKNMNKFQGCHYSRTGSNTIIFQTLKK